MDSFLCHTMECYYSIVSFTVVYHCGSHLGWSSLFWFTTPPEDLNTWSPQLAIFGDLGSENAQSLPYLQEEVQRGLYDAILHIGDFAYDMDTVSNNILFICKYTVNLVEFVLVRMTSPCHFLR